MSNKKFKEGMNVTSYLKGTIYMIIEKKYGIWLFKVKMLYNKPFGMSNNFLVHIKKIGSEW